MADMEPAFLYYETNVAHDIALLDRLTQGCYLQLLQHYRKYRGFTAVLLRYILGIDYEHAWQSLQFVLEYDDIEEKYHIGWLRQAVAEREAFNVKEDKTSENQRARVNKRWAKVREEKAKKAQNGNTAEEPTQINGNTAVIPPYNSGNTQVILFNTNTVKNTDWVSEEGGMGEEEEGDDGIPPKPPPQLQWPPLSQNPLVAGMARIYEQATPGYLRDDGKDLPACLQIAYAIADRNDWPWQTLLDEHLEDVLAAWQSIVDYIVAKSWYRNKQLSIVSNNFQTIITEKYAHDTGKDTRKTDHLGTGEAQVATARTWGLGGAR